MEKSDRLILSALVEKYSVAVIRAALAENTSVSSLITPESRTSVGAYSSHFTPQQRAGVGYYAFIHEGEIIFSKNKNDYPFCIGIIGYIDYVVPGRPRGLIVSLGEQNMTWGAVDGLVACRHLDDDNGIQNVKTVLEYAQTRHMDFPAFDYCQNLEVHGIHGWFLGSVNEYKKCMKNLLDYDPILARGIFRERNIYWTSSAYQNRNGRGELDGLIKCVGLGKNPSHKYEGIFYKKLKNDISLYEVFSDQFCCKPLLAF